MSMISEKLAHLKERIHDICQRCHRNAEDIVIVGVTKYTDADAIVQAMKVGLTDIGENRVQDAEQKFEQLTNPAVLTKHLIGHLQTNKVKKAVQLFHMIQSVDSVKLVNEIEKHAAKINKKVDILIQVNVAGETQKFGCDPDSVSAIIDRAASSPHVHVQGLMTMAPHIKNKQKIRDCFGGLKVLFDQLSKEWSGSSQVTMKYLSMGMSEDYDIAIEEGANMLRIGSAIFK